MDRKEFLSEFYKEVELTFGVDVSKKPIGVKFALNCLRKKMTIQETVKEFGDTFYLIKL